MTARLNRHNRDLAPHNPSNRGAAPQPALAIRSLPQAMALVSHWIE